MELIILMGIQASGKSTFCRKTFYDTHLRLNLDMLKTRNRETILFNACIESKTKIIIDNTNPQKEDRKRYIEIAKKNKYTIIGYYFSSKVDIALERNKNREKSVPHVAILSTCKRLETPDYEEGFDELYYIDTETEDFKIRKWENEVY